MKTAMNNEQEIRLWITYRVARQMFKVLNREAHLPVSALAQSDNPIPLAQSPEDATRQFQQEAEAVSALEDLDFATAYQERPSVVSEQTLLVVDSRFVSINDQLHNMQLVCANGVNVNMGLNRQLVLAISRMLMIASQDAGWTLPVQKEPEAVSSIVMQVDTEKQVLH